MIKCCVIVDSLLNCITTLQYCNNVIYHDTFTIAVIQYILLAVLLSATKTAIGYR